MPDLAQDTTAFDASSQHVQLGPTLEDEKSLNIRVGGMVTPVVPINSMRAKSLKNEISTKSAACSISSSPILPDVSDEYSDSEAAEEIQLQSIIHPEPKS